MLDDDEGIYVLMGRFLTEGRLPYVHYWDHQPPLIYFVSALVQFLGLDGVWGSRMAGAVFVGLTSFFLFRLARRISGNQVIAAAVGGLYLFLASLPCLNGTAFNNEIIFNCFSMWCLDEVTRRFASGRSRPKGYFIPGLIIGTGLLTKQQVLFDYAPFGVLILLSGKNSSFLKERLPALLFYCAGAAVPTLSFALVYLLGGHFDAYWIANWSSNLVYMESGKNAIGNLYFLLRKLRSLAWITPWILGGAVAAWFSVRPPSTGIAPRRFAAFLWLWAGTVLWGTTLSGMYYEHYFIQVLNPASLFLVYALHAAWECRARKTRRLLQGLFALCVAAVAVQSGIAVQFSACTRSPHPWREVAAYIREKAGPNDSLYVADGDVVLYAMTGLDVPTRFAFPAHMTRKKYAAAFQFDPLCELRRILDGNPDWIVVDQSEIHSDRDFESARMENLLNEKLKTGYRLEKRMRRKIRRVFIDRFEVRTLAIDILIYRRETA
jgi:4-amino-4-deoxy-L-arabinose transferase-like glycosyltransferase